MSPAEYEMTASSFSAALFSTIAALLLQVQLHAPFHPLRWNVCILHFTSKRTLPTQKGQHHTEHWSVQVPDIYYLISQVLSMCTGTQLKVRLKWSYWQTQRSELSQKADLKAWAALWFLSSPHAADGVVRVVLAIFHKLPIACKCSVWQKKQPRAFWFLK